MLVGCRLAGPNIPVTERTGPWVYRLGMYATLRALLMALALLAAGCSGSDEQSAESTTTPTAQPTSVADITSTTAATTSTDESTTSTSEQVVTSDVPSSFWAVDRVTYDLVEVALDGKIITTITGYGAEQAADESSPQSLATTDFVGSKVVVSDCCEPVAGNTFIVDPDFTDAIPGANVPLAGRRPAVSPSGQRIAVQMLDLSVAFYTIDGGSLDIDTGGLKDKLAMPDANDAVVTYPLAWFDETTLAIVVSGETQAAVSIVDIADLSNPVVLATFTVDGFVVAGAANAEGELMIALLFDGPIMGLRFDLESGSSFEMELPGYVQALEDIQTLDFDSTGTYLLITQFGTVSPMWAPMG